MCVRVSEREMRECGREEERESVCGVCERERERERERK